LEFHEIEICKFYPNLLFGIAQIYILEWSFFLRSERVNIAYHGGNEDKL